jgi:ribosome assembly protein RRB1
MDWSPVSPGQLATGSCDAKIIVWDVNAAAAGEAMGGAAGVTDMSGVWSVRSDRPFHSHTDSVEDLQWSPNEATVFASASVDKTVRIWDTRSKGVSMLNVAAHEADVNVISWSKLVAYLLVSGCDDGSFKIWDLRNFKRYVPSPADRSHT